MLEGCNFNENSTIQMMYNDAWARRHGGSGALCPLIWTKIQESQDAQIRSADDRVDWLFVRPS